MKSTLILIPTITVHPNRITFYNQIQWEPFRPSRPSYFNEEIEFYKNQDEEKNSKYQHLLESSRTAEGRISPNAKRKIVKAIDYLLLFASDKKITSVATGRKYTFKIAFITLTLPAKQNHSDNEIKRTCLNSFMLELQKYHKVKNYVWRAEKQKNGNIHFHIIIDKFVHWNSIRSRWNRIINKLGYVDEYRSNMKEFYKNGFKVKNELIKSWSEARQRVSYKANLETGFNNPNSTDIHSIQKIHNLSHYFIKYMTKNKEVPGQPEKEEIEFEKQTGRVWGSSQNLQNIKGAKIVVDNQIQEELEEIIKKTKCAVYDSAYFSVFNISFPELQLVANSNIFLEFCRYLETEFGFTYQTEILQPG